MSKRKNIGHGKMPSHFFVAKVEDPATRPYAIKVTRTEGERLIHEGTHKPVRRKAQ